MIRSRLYSRAFDGYYFVLEMVASLFSGLFAFLIERLPFPRIEGPPALDRMRVLRRLRPVYHHSYATAGHSLVSPRHRFAM